MKALGVALFLISTHAVAEEGCLYANQKFSLGSTRCECPSVKLEHIASTGEKGQVTSRRMSCTKGGAWTDTKALCIDISGSATLPEFYRLSRMNCPLSLNPEE